MELKKKNIHMDVQKAKTAIQTTLEKDVNISDLKPDAQKLILDKGNVVIQDVKVTDDHAEVKGKLQYQILYLCDEEKTNIEKMEGELSFDEQLYIAGVETGDDVQVQAEMEDLNTVLINSRKFSVQALVQFSVVCNEIAESEAATEVEAAVGGSTKEVIGGDNGKETVEIRKKELELVTLAEKKKDIFRWKEEVEIPGNYPNIAELVWNDICTENVEFQFTDDKIGIQGDIRLFFLYRAQDEENGLYHYETTIPFSGTLDCDHVRDGMIPEISYTTEVREVAVRPDLDEEDRVVSFELCLHLDICAYEEEKMNILSDVYGVVQEAKTVTKEIRLKKYAGSCNGKIKLLERYPIKDVTDPVKATYVKGNIKSINTDKTVEGIEVNGEAVFQVLYEDNGEEGRYGSCQVQLPFHQIIETEETGNDCIYSVKAELQQVSATISDENEMELKAVLCMQVNVYKEWTEKIIEEIDTEELDNKKMDALPGMAVYMVQDGESLWDIGKKYYVTVAALKQVNELAGEEVKPGDRILIVR